MVMRAVRIAARIIRASNLPTNTRARLRRPQYSFHSSMHSCTLRFRHRATTRATATRCVFWLTTCSFHARKHWNTDTFCMRRTAWANTVECRDGMRRRVADADRPGNGPNPSAGASSPPPAASSCIAAQNATRCHVRNRVFTRRRQLRTVARHSSPAPTMRRMEGASVAAASRKLSCNRDTAWRNRALTRDCWWASFST